MLLPNKYLVWIFIVDLLLCVVSILLSLNTTNVITGSIVFAWGCIVGIFTLLTLLTLLFKKTRWMSWGVLEMAILFGVGGMVVGIASFMW
jgi:membrane-associated HD superfamily phosphohydrolase